MAETPSEQQAQTQTQTQVQVAPAGLLDPNSLQYWCYNCNRRVSIETSADLPDIICHECKNGFVESIDSSHQTPLISGASDSIDDPALGNQFLQVLRLIAQATRDDDAPPPPPSEHADPSDDDYLRIELDGWDNDDDEDGEEGEEEDDDDENQSVVRNEDSENNQEGENGNRGQSEVDGEEEEEDEDDDDDEDNENGGGGLNVDDLRRRRRDVLRLRLRDFSGRAADRRNRILDWAEILMGLEDHSIELRFAMPDGDGYVGNPGDYVDAAGYEALLQNLAENDSGGRRGAPPAAKDAVKALETLEIKAESEKLACAICKDVVVVGEIAKKLPCGHGYHGDCIGPWLGSRNSCPVCRYELPTDDQDYEEEKKKRAGGAATSASTSGGGSGFGDEFV